MSLVKSIEFFQRAIQKEPRYALAHAGLADAYGLLPSFLGTDSPREKPCPRQSCALKALEIDDSLAEAYASLALVLHRYEWDWKGAEKTTSGRFTSTQTSAAPSMVRLVAQDSGAREEALAELKELKR